MNVTATPFPFETLPRFTAADIVLLKRLTHAYSFFVSRARLVDDVLVPLKEIFETDVDFQIVHAEAGRFEDLQKKLAQGLVYGAVTIEPHAKKALVVFETLLAKLMVYRPLSGSQFDKNRLIDLQTRPVTALEEAVVQYIIVSVIDRLNTGLGEKKFNLVCDVIGHEPAQLGRLIEKDTVLGVLSLRVRLLERDFYIKLFLPLDVASHYGIDHVEEKVLQQRLTQFGGFNTHLVLEAATVTLDSQDLSQLREGDIVLLDESKIALKDRQISGQARMKPESVEYGQGYIVDLEVAGDLVRARVAGGL